MIKALADALLTAAAMGWKMLWALILGFAVSAVIQAVVSKKEIARILPDAGAGTIARAAALGAASSSCSYAAAAITRAIVRRGGDFRAAMAFQFASTNLVLELGLVLWSLLGWRFTLAQFAGGLVMIILLTTALRLSLPHRLLESALRHARGPARGKMEGHAGMDMAVPADRSLLRRLASAEGLTAVSHIFVSEILMVWGDIGAGLLISGAVAAWIPPQVWPRVFAVHDPVTAALVGPLLGPLVALLTFVCSIGNVPLAAILWSSGASFGGVIAFLFADLIVLPLLDMYRRYYGWAMAGYLLAVFWGVMAVSAYLVEAGFRALHLTPAAPKASAHGVSLPFAWNATTALDLLMLAVAGFLVWRFVTTGGPRMMAMMKGGGGGGGGGGTPGEPPSCGEAAQIPWQLQEDSNFQDRERLSAPEGLTGLFRSMNP